ncbi:ankyrin repeat domain-containing protein [Candidatus Tisiphia endosymbiont of Ptychoptera albimana]|uniref:ankyrin repeat domain-containing protein n=1 Tax=Candidatus Tisiphia endosymbiont of Ptychoptera albimana TaxID=3066260 RepID=UPI00312CA063
MTNTGLSINSVGVHNSNVTNTLSIPKAYVNTNSNDYIDTSLNLFNDSIKRFGKKNNYGDSTIIEPPTLIEYIKSRPYRGYETQKIIHQLIDNIPNSYNPLHAAAYYGYLDIMEFLLEQGIDIDVKSDNGDTPLLIVALTGNLEGMKFLVEKGADVTIKNNEGFSVLHIAAQRNVAVSAIKFLVKEGADINVQDGYGNSPLHDAARFGQNDIIKLLIDKGADINAQDEHGNTPLDIAISEKHTDSAELLIDKAADINEQDEHVDSTTDKYLEESDIEFTTVTDSIDTYNKTFVKDSQNQDNDALTPLYYYLAAGVASVITFGGVVACYLLNKKQHKNEATNNDGSYYNYQNPESNLIEFMGKPVTIIDIDNTKTVCVVVSSENSRPLSVFLSEIFHNTIQYLGGYHPKSIQDGSSNTIKEGNSSTVEVSSPTVGGNDSSIYDYLPPPRPVDFSDPNFSTVVLVGDSL